MLLANRFKTSRMKGSDSMIKPAVSGDKTYRFYLTHTGKGIALPFEPLQKILLLNTLVGYW